ncbi:hypothetical protein [Streptomyces sp. NBC_01233]|uniref:hypothetical protein n=1 Tax=Streptomyces sp. NBC_01233 TaxID=2903787 RepID=UPI002E13918C|nr:hypothetical protein OG332_03680 [Streptomyces sp. NBC_01233]
MASLLMERGHFGILHSQAAAGDWFCAHRLAQATLEDDPEPPGRQTALALLEPFVATGWMKAVSTVVGLLAEWDRLDEAIALLRRPADSGHRQALRQLATLLARQGRIDEVIALLGPRATDLVLAESLVELTADHGRDEEIAALLPAVSVGPPDPFEPWRSDDWDTVPLHATLLERQGRVDEAVSLLHGHVYVDGVMYADHAQQLACLLARHGREAELREFAADGGEEYALAALADHLEERQRIDDAVDTLRAADVSGNPHVALHLSELLARHGRRSEAIDTAWRTGSITFPEEGDGDPDGANILFELLVDRSPDAYAAWASEYYETPVNVEAVRALLAQRPLTPELVAVLNPEVGLADLAEDISEIGYPG